MDIDSFQFDNTLTNLTLHGTEGDEMSSTGYYDNCESLYEDYEEVPLRDIDPEDLMEWTHFGDSSKIDVKTELNSGNLIQDIFSIDCQDYMQSEECTPCVPTVSQTPSADSLPDLSNPWVQEFIFYMSKLSISMQRSELSREAIRKHRDLILCRLQQPEVPPGQHYSAPVFYGDMNIVSKINSLRAPYIERVSRINKAA